MYVYICFLFKAARFKVGPTAVEASVTVRVRVRVRRSVCGPPHCLRDYVKPGEAV